MEFGEVMIGALAVIGIFILPAIVFAYLIYYLLKTRNQERMELIKQGIIPASQTRANPNRLTSLRNGCLFIGMALGLIIGLILDNFLGFSYYQSFFFILSSIIMFLGIGYVTFYLLSKNKNNEEE